MLVTSQDQAFIVSVLRDARPAAKAAPPAKKARKDEHALATPDQARHCWRMLFSAALSPSC